MSLTKEVISEINRLNASKSTGPESQLGKQRSRQESEVEAFGAPPDAYRILSYLPPPKGAQTLPQPANPADPCTPGDLVTGASTQNSEENMAA